MGNETITGVGFDNAQVPFDQNKTVNANHVLGANAIGNLLNMGMDAWKNVLNFKLMNSMFDLQTAQMTKYYGLQDRLVDLNESLMGSQEKVALAQLKTTEKIAELQKDRDIAVAKSRNSAAVKIAKVNALNAQFYGQPNSLPSWS